MNDAPATTSVQAFDKCADGHHYARCTKVPFEPCPDLPRHWHFWYSSTQPYRYLGRCPEAGEHGEPAEQACQP